MSTLTLQTQVQRHRFAHHAVAAMVARVPEQLRSLFAGSQAPLTKTVADEAHAVREMAGAYQQTDPGFAADLYAAAARHEGVNAD